jgi:thiol:disulfide interchange protein
MFPESHFLSSSQVLDDDIAELVDNENDFDSVSESFASFLKTMAMCYAWGLLASLTPCVYPMLPTTVALFAGDNARGGGGAKSVWEAGGEELKNSPVVRISNP